MQVVIRARLVLDEWLPDHTASKMLRSWVLTEQQRRHIVALIKAEIGEPQTEVLVSLEAIKAMDTAGKEHGFVVWGAE